MGDGQGKREVRVLFMYVVLVGLTERMFELGFEIGLCRCLGT